MSYKAPSGLSNISDLESSIVPKNKNPKFKKAQGNMYKVLLNFRLQYYILNRSLICIYLTLMKSIANRC